jgi:hypothetical protein
MTTKQTSLQRSPPPAERRPIPRLSPGARPHGLAPSELVKLHHSLIEALSTGSGVITQLLAPERDAAITQVAYDLAYISASWLDKRVLYVNGTKMRVDDDDEPAAVTGKNRFPHSLAPGDLEASITRVVGLNLYQMTFPTLRDALDLAPSIRGIPEFMDRLRQTFDLVVIASPAASDAPMGVLLSPYVDGNIIVLESGRVRATVAVELRDAMRSSGGNVIGVVLTRCDSFAPRWLQRWL